MTEVVEQMALEDDLKAKVKTIFKDQWTKTDGRTVPDDDDVGLDNDAVKITGAVLYADLAESTKLVDGSTPEFAAEVYKTYLYCAARIIGAEGGAITAYDGDRVMAVFIGKTPCSDAVRTALKINHACKNVIEPAITNQYPNATYKLQQVVGIDRSDLFVARTGIRGANDLVWVGRAANYAAKLSALPSSMATYITQRVYDVLTDDTKLSSGKNMWTVMTAKDAGGGQVLGSNWTWRL